jgi:uncharacterized RDD family membrane protein YckC
MPSEKIKYHTFWKRLAAGIIDGIIFMPLYYCADFIADHAKLRILLYFLIFIFSATYSILLHAKYGQTIGKKVLHIKVYSLDEQNVIGLKRAFYRDSVWVFTEVAGLIYFLITSSQAPTDSIDTQSNFEDFVSTVTFLWFVLELVTMFLNSKKRALHDYLAKSVVINLD